MTRKKTAGSNVNIDLMSSMSSNGTNAGTASSKAPVGDTVIRGTHEYVPEFDMDAELEGSEYTSQMEVLYYLLRGDNIVLCGQAGAGKSWVIDTFRKIAEHCNALMERENKSFNIAMTASTGVAASLIRGKTIHSWSGLGINVDKFDPRLLNEKDNRIWKRASKRIKQTDCLIIDEVSMLPAYFLTNLDRACKLAKGKTDKPFGGIQVVLVGDFLQLPPVSRNEVDRDGNPIDARYCFKAVDNHNRPIFGVSGFKWCYLDKVRRSDDNRLTDLLNDIRNEAVTQQDMKNLASRFNTSPMKGKAYTQLRTMNHSVDAYNKRKLDELHGEPTRYTVHREGDMGKADEMVKAAGLSTVELKPGAVVMLTSNRAVQGDEKRVNGSMGKVVSCDPGYVTIRFNDGAERDVYKITERTTKMVVKYVWDEEKQQDMPFEEEVEIASISYLPVRLAWAITVHKSQGQTLDGAIIDLSKCFQRGLGYVALSRCRSLDDIIMRGSMDELPLDALKVDADAINADRRIRHKAQKDREVMLGNEREFHDLESVLPTAGSRTAEARIRRKMEQNPSVMMILEDDASCFEWVRNHRAVYRKKRKRRDEWASPKKPTGTVNNQ